MKQKYSGILKISLFVIVAAVAVWFVRDAFFAEKKVEVPESSWINDRDGRARVIFNYGEDVSVSTEIIAGGTVLDTTKAAAAGKNITVETKEYPGMGSLVTKIGDKKNGEGGAYWQFWVNGAYATSSADNIVVNPNDIIEWKFTSSAQ